MSEYLFFSYAHKDGEWLDRILMNLRPLMKERKISLELWTDGDIVPGDKWYDEIDMALTNARAAVLLLSPHFLASAFIQNEEWLRIQEAASERRLRILWVPVRASTAQDLAYGEYHALCDSQAPLEGLSEAEQSSIIVEICKKICDAVSVPDRHKDVRPDQSFPIASREYETIAVGHKGELWLADETRVRRRHLLATEDADQFELPTGALKTIVPRVWRSGLIAPAWDGSVLHVRAPADGGHDQLYTARGEGVPFHAISVARDESVAATAWDRRLLRWDAGGQLRPPTIECTEFPTGLVALEGGAVAVATEENEVALYDIDASKAWNLQLDASVDGIWGFGTGQSAVVVVLVDGSRLVWIDARGVAEEQKLDSPVDVVKLSRSQQRLLVLQGRKMSWVSTQTLRVVVAVQLPCGVRQIEPVDEGAGSFAHQAVGLDDDGYLFSVRESQVSRDRNGEPSTALLVSGDGRFVYLCCEKSIGVRRSPTWDGRQFSVKLVSAEGALTMGRVGRLVVKMRNTSTMPISHYLGVLSREGVIERCPSEPGAARNTVDPGGEFSLEFFVSTKQAGEIRLNLAVSVEDELGPQGDPVSVGVDVRVSPSD